MIMDTKPTYVRSESRELYEKVIKNDYCIGCGACTFVQNSPFKVQMDKYGNMVAYPYQDLDVPDVRVLGVCPFSESAKNEDELSEIYFPRVENSSDKIGKYLACYAGYVQRGDFRKKGSSGGLGKWLGYILLKDKKIDFLVHVVPNYTKDSSKPLFDYTITSDPGEVSKGSKSAYYPVTLSHIIRLIKERKGKYAVTGIPCFIKALRLLSLTDKDIKERIKYTIGIVCGGMKSANQAKMIGWQLGVKPENLVAIDFRRKYEDKPASYKIYQVWSNLDDKERYRDSYDIFATDWGAGYFKPNACDYCDDVVNETADISIGDAWLPQFEPDPKGTSLLVVRNSELLEIIHKYEEDNTLTLFELTVEEVAAAQAGGFRHRREGLSYRIAKKEKEKHWYPPKRVRPGDYPLTKKRKKLYDLREKIARKSHEAFLHALEKEDLGTFYKEMRSLVRRYHALNYGILPVRAIKKLKRILLRYLKGT